MKALKVLVIGMGLLILIGLALVGYGLYRNTHPQASTTARQAAGRFNVLPEPPPAAGTGGGSGAGGGGGYVASEVAVPPGAHLDQVLAAGNRIVLHFSGPAGEADRLLMIDPESGQVAGTVTLVPSQPAAKPAR